MGMGISTKENLYAQISLIRKAQQKYSTFSQEQVDKIFKEVALIANKNRILFAKQVVEETKMGIVEDKVIKNHFAAEYIYNKYKNEKTCGILESNNTWGIKKVAEPIGLIAGIIPTTNPTSTVIFKTLLALKTRNAIIFSPHPRAKKSTVDMAKLLLETAVKNGAPENIIGWIEEPSVELSQYLMQEVDLTLATGGGAMVKSAYSSGKPAIGVGSGNTPVVIDETVDVKLAVNSIIISKTFDNGLICSAESTVIALKECYEAVKKEFKARNCYILNASEKNKLLKVLVTEKGLNPEIVGQSAYKIATMANLEIPKFTKVLLAEATEIGHKEPFSKEKLSPLLGLYKADSFDEAILMAKKQLNIIGIGHTSVLYTHRLNEERINKFGLELNTARILINQPSSHGAIGDLYNFKLEPSLTLGCGSWGGNSVSENVGVKHLLNIKTISERRENMLWFRIPPKIYFKSGSLPLALQELAGKKRAFIVTDKILDQLGYTEKVTSVLRTININYHIFSDVEPNPSLATVNRALLSCRSFEPDVFIALGGGSPIDASKIIWLLYEHPDEDFENLAMRFMDIRKRISVFPELGKKAIMIAIPTTSGTGSEVTPFAVITDEKTGIKYAIADYELTPDVAIIDPDLVLSMPKTLTAHSGLDALTHAIEAYTSVIATEYTNGLALEAIKLIFDYLPASYTHGKNDPVAREKVHYASAIAGMAFSNAFLGICHSMAHKLGAEFDIAHGLANILLLPYVIRYNATDTPTKQTAFSQYQYPNTKERYGKISDYLWLKGKTVDEKIENLIAEIENIKKKLDIPSSIKKLGISEKDFNTKLDRLSELAFDDQCTGANPRYPLISEIKQIYLDAYEGN